MALLLIITSWLLLSALVAGLCLAARLGDRQVQPSVHAPAARAGAGEKPATLELQRREAA
jgi:hypothetical protein